MRQGKLLGIARATIVAVIFVVCGAAIAELVQESEPEAAAPAAIAPPQARDANAVRTNDADPSPDAGPSPALLAYAQRADQICFYNYQVLVRGEREVEKLGRRENWPGPRIEAGIRYAFANAMANQHRMLLDLGDPPQLADVMRQWVKTSKERSELQRQIAEAWLASRDTSKLVAAVSLAKLKADVIAERMPFQTCGTPEDRPPPLSRRQQLADPRRTYLAEGPASSDRLIDVGTDVYKKHQRAGKVVDVVRGADSIVFEFRMKPAYRREMIDSALQLYRSHEDPSFGWLTMVPSGNELPGPPAVTILASTSR